MKYISLIALMVATVTNCMQENIRIVRLIAGDFKNCDMHIESTITKKFGIHNPYTDARRYTHSVIRNFLAEFPEKKGQYSPELVFFGYINYEGIQHYYCAPLSAFAIEDHQPLKDIQ